MRKKILGSLAVIAIAAVATFNVTIGTPNSATATISLSNVEALADGENPNCPNGCKANGDGCFCNYWFPTDREA
ncbi:NVEALA domain-containing protein [Sphingobacterium pedocola]|uniref:Secreted protein n=1 Tax=Sphingobacterium pedocola TaxID=2082722 RepID=A0ABR9TAH2_9SPHI|nr:NVEALA domain-containing protein [Sphingobacterium pedocola]MBE8722336.1 hypothetical protein [Sphingobacterium pedocola]